MGEALLVEQAGAMGALVQANQGIPAGGVIVVAPESEEALGMLYHRKKIEASKAQRLSRQMNRMEEKIVAAVTKKHAAKKEMESAIETAHRLQLDYELMKEESSQIKTRILELEGRIRKRKRCTVVGEVQQVQA